MPIVLVTGASTGIGLASVVLFARKGYRVFAGVRNPEKAELLRAAIEEGLPIRAVRLDVDSDESVLECTGEIMAEAGAVDVLVNNAGISGGGPIELVDLEFMRALFETNFFGVMRTIRAALPGMRERRSGAIVNVTSIAGRVAWGAHAPYSATKSALEMASECLAIELRPLGIRVATVSPGTVLTPIWRKASGEYPTEGPYGMIVRRLFRLCQAQLVEPTMPEEAAAVIVDAVESESPKLRYAAGADAVVTLEARAQLTDEEWIDLQTEPDDERFLERARDVFGMELYSPPSAQARMWGGNQS